ncbi:hypothetical protein [Lentilitoribacter sp. Alg239-R112]|uniref:hypothetical protein n=1 Tax=Lentilitoribacter sp. Alg239-R112 TaxID=2305987 RepID=UPI0013A68DB9|nr:hypothetical protein [Lentilitoribacter sp. Alg239-R112]
MPTPPVPEEELKRRYQAYLDDGRQGAANKLGLDVCAIDRARKWAAAHGLTPTGPVMDGYRISKSSSTLDEKGNILKQHIQQKPDLGDEYEMPDNFETKKRTIQIGANGQIERQWDKIDRKGAPDPREAKEIIESALSGFKGFGKRKKPKGLDRDSLFWLPVSDLHIGACYKSNDKRLRWGSKDTISDIKGAVVKLIDEAPPCGSAIIQGLGDICDYDGLESVTSKSNNILETDLSSSEMLDEAMHLFHWMVDLSLEKFGKVHLSMVRGNHDLVTTHSIKSYVKGVYLKEPDVTVDTSDDPHVLHTHFDHMIFATHADEMKPSEMPNFMSKEHAKAWGKAKIRWGYCGHRHKYEKSGESGGVLVEQQPPIVRANRYARGHGYSSYRGMHSAVFKSGGRVVQNRVFFQ